MFIPREHPFAIAILCLAGLVGTPGCARKPDDVEIVNSIQTEIQTDPAVTGEVKVESKRGLVTLNGHVSSEAERALVGREAKGTAGVVGVLNDLTVEPPKKAASRGGSRKNPLQSHNSEESRVINDEPSAPGVAASPAAIAESTSPVNTAPEVTPAITVAPAPPAASIPVATPPPPVAVKHVIEAGTSISIRLVDALDSARNKVGDTFRATLKIPLNVDGDVVIRAGADIEGRVADVSNAGRFTGHSELNLELTKLSADGKVYPLQTQGYDRLGDRRDKGTAETVGGGAVVGAIIGALGRKRITFPSETVLIFKLQNAVTVVTTQKSADSSGSP